MNISVVGLWHLGCVTAACLANSKHNVIAYDPNHDTIVQLKKGQPPIFEPGLGSLLQKGQANGELSYTADKKEITHSDIIWITFDTPVDDNDIADVHFVTQEIQALFPYVKDKALIIISSQMPVGSTRKLQQDCAARYPDKKITFAYSPENLRLGKAIEVFTKPDRIVVGLETESDQDKIQQLLAPFTQTIIWMSIESAEMTKHALNAFLATSVVFINELSALCERVGANAREVERGLKSEERIGPKAYLRPGNPIAGGTLARDVNFLIEIGNLQKLDTPLFSALLNSNQFHKQWACRRLLDLFKDIQGKTITLLGLTYKADTNTLRRSTAIETAKWLKQQKAKVVAYDPSVKSLPSELTEYIDLKTSLSEALKDSEALIISTEWPEFLTLTPDELLKHIPRPIVFDPGSFLMQTLGKNSRIRYFSVGSAS